MEKRIIHPKRAVVAHNEPAEISQPGERAFDFPTVAIAAQWPAILGRGFAAVLAMGTDQFDAPGLQLFSQGIAVVGAIGNESPHAAFGPPWLAAGHPHLRQRPLDQLHFCWRGRVQVVSQRNTLAVDHHHPLRALATLGFANAVAPFLAGAKLPSMKLSLQSSWPRWSSSARKCRQTLSQTSCCSQRRSRRQQVAGLTPKSGGRSRQRAPVLSTHKMPSRTARLSFHGRPALDRLGSKGSSLAHCSSDNRGFAMPSLLQNQRKGSRIKYLQQVTL